MGETAFRDWKAVVEVKRKSVYNKRIKFIERDRTGVLLSWICF